MQNRIEKLSHNSHNRGGEWRSLFEPITLYMVLIKFVFRQCRDGATKQCTLMPADCKPLELCSTTELYCNFATLRRNEMLSAAMLPHYRPRKQKM